MWQPQRLARHAQRPVRGAPGAGVAALACGGTQLATILLKGMPSGCCGARQALEAALAAGKAGDARGLAALRERVRGLVGGRAAEPDVPTQLAVRSPLPAPHASLTAALPHVRCLSSLLFVVFFFERMPTEQLEAEQRG
jgi:hypothetical protein